MANFADFYKEAERRVERSGINRTPYEITFENGDKIQVPYPDADIALRISQVPESDTVGMLSTIFSNRPQDFNRLFSELKGAPVEVIAVLVEEMYDHWNDDSLRVPGKAKG